MEKLISKIEDMNIEMQSIIGTDEEIANDYADGYNQAIKDVIELIRKQEL
jgi:hypothetical protein